MKKGDTNCFKSSIFKSRNRINLLWTDKEFWAFKKKGFGAILNHFHGIQWSKLCNTTLFCSIIHRQFTWCTTKKHRKWLFWSKFQCHKSRSHTEWASPPRSRSLLNLIINPPCELSCVPGKGLGRSTGTEVTPITGHECGSSLWTYSTSNSG